MLGHSVLNLHRAVIELRPIELLDGVLGRAGLCVDERSGAQILTLHVPVEARSDQRSTLREEFLQRDKTTVR